MRYSRNAFFVRSTGVQVPRQCTDCSCVFPNLVFMLAPLHHQAEYEDIVEECQLWTKLATLEQLCAEQGLSAAGGFANG